MADSQTSVAVPFHKLVNMSVDEKSTNQFIRDDEKSTNQFMSECAGKNKYKKMFNVNKITMNVQTFSSRFKHFRANYELTAMYSKDETLSTIFNSIISHFNYEHYPQKAKIFKISGFMKDTICGWDMDKANIVNRPITNWSRQEIQDHSLIFEVDLAKYNHIIKEASINCPNMIKKNSNKALDCHIYKSMKEKYEWNENNLNHLHEYNHFKDEFVEKPTCIYYDKCKWHKKLENGSNGINELCHIKLYRHAPRNRNITLSPDIHSLVVNTSKKQNYPLYVPYDDCIYHDLGDGDDYLTPLMIEVEDNGFKCDLCLRIECKKDNECKNCDKSNSILQIVDTKMKCMRHAAMSYPLNRGQMLALILYTGGECNYDLSKEQRNGNYNKWKWFDYCLYTAIEALSKREQGSYAVYTGLNNVKLKQKSLDCGYFVTYTSTSWQKYIAISFTEGNGMIIRIDESFQNPIKGRFCCDVSWISKFPDECEVLYARGLKYQQKFKCQILNDSQGVQTVGLSAVK